ncbi:MAG: glycerol-3-phosphate 1-O-acyltransferase PlsY [Thioalkalivibrionaceae bacterium]
MLTASFILGLVLAYALGSVSSAIVLSRLFGLPDPRNIGSGNPGATNILRTGRKGLAAATLIGDAAKGWLPVYIALQLEHTAVGPMPLWMVALIGLAAFLGHLFPIWHGLRGGKGVATAFGIVLAIDPITAGLTLVTWLLIAATTRYSSLAALTAATLAPVYYSFSSNFTLHAEGWLLTLMATVALLLYWRHDANIRRLLRHEEPRIGERRNQ